MKAWTMTMRQTRKQKAHLLMERIGKGPKYLCLDARLWEQWARQVTPLLRELVPELYDEAKLAAAMAADCYRNLLVAMYGSERYYYKNTARALGGGDVMQTIIMRRRSDDVVLLALYVTNYTRFPDETK